jgi:hypothetical protein
MKVVKMCAALPSRAYLNTVSDVISGEKVTYHSYTYSFKVFILIPLHGVIENHVKRLKSTPYARRRRAVPHVVGWK